MVVLLRLEFLNTVFLPPALTTKCPFLAQQSNMLNSPTKAQGILYPIFKTPCHFLSEIVHAVQSDQKSRILGNPPVSTQSVFPQYPRSRPAFRRCPQHVRHLLVTNWLSHIVSSARDLRGLRSKDLHGCSCVSRWCISSIQHMSDVYSLQFSPCNDLRVKTRTACKFQKRRTI